ncbi:branched-chain amino acid ABC transporter permease [Aeromicrobium sp. Leaf350]|uniref:branched-chain amino acid ABC transporter permease n=1 Tax=Aeromicrobium sp. Leaf350 TaxID=2876565 RepID=UPI001E5F7B19|nr:branched-chain amino acid ABC transporter permease [Aeromicrobium sp. Leaf350]
MIEFVVQGLALGALYALIAIPLSLVWLTAHTLDLAIGGYAVMGGMAFATASDRSTGLALALGVGALCGLVSAALFVTLRRLGATDPMAPGLVSVGVLIALGSLAQAIFGIDPAFQANFEVPIEIGGVRINPQVFLNFAAVAVILGLIVVVLRYTGLGRAMRASAASPADASLVGIGVSRLQSLVFVLGGMLGALAGALLVMTSGLSFEFGLGLTLSAIGAVILFGLRGPVTAVLGGLTIGVVEALGSGYAPAGIGPAVPVLFVFIVLASGVFDFDDRTVRP